MKSRIAWIMIICVVMVFSFVHVASSKDIGGSMDQPPVSFDMDGIIRAAKRHVQNHGSIGIEMTEDEMSSIRIGGPINTYILGEDGSLKQQEVTVYPLFIGEHGIMEISDINFDPSDPRVDPSFERYIAASSSIAPYLSCFYGKNVAIVYDCESMVIVSDETKCITVPFLANGGDRGKFRLNDLPEILSQIELQKAEGLKDVFAPGEKVSLEKGDPNYPMPKVELLVPKVSQIYSQTCWAACIASIGNYLTSYTYSVPYIIQHKYGAVVNQTAYLSDCVSELSSIYGITYNSVYNSTTPSAAYLYQNLADGYPLFGAWKYYVGLAYYGHAAVIRGYYHAYSDFYVMDPYNMEYYTGQRSSGNGYSYQNSSSGYTLTLQGFAAKY